MIIKFYFYAYKIKLGGTVLKKIFLILFMTMLLTGCTKNGDNSGYIEQSEFLMNTIITIRAETQDIEIVTEAFNTIRNIENRLSNTVSESEVSKINQNAGIKSVEVSNDTFDIIKNSIHYSKISDGYFDITVAPLSDLWNINSDKPKVPAEEEIKKAIKLIDSNLIELDENKKTVFLKHKGMKIDLGAIAKGYAADKTKDFLIAEGVKRAILNLGGNVYVIGEKDEGKPWKVGIQNPETERSESIGYIECSDISVVTCATNQRYFEENGKRYHHIFNVKDGYPMNNGLKSVTVVAKSSEDSDALATTAFLSGLDKGKNLIENTDGFEAIFIDNDKHIYLTEGLKDKFVLTDDTFVSVDE